MARVLVIDDDSKILDLLNLTLSREGHDVVCTSDIFSAEDLAEKYKFDLILSDINLPKKKRI